MNALTEINFATTTAISTMTVPPVEDRLAVVTASLGRLEDAADALHTAYGAGSDAWDADTPEDEFKRVTESADAVENAASAEFDAAFEAVTANPPTSGLGLSAFLSTFAYLLEGGYGYLLVEDSEKMGKLVPMMRCAANSAARLSGSGNAPAHVVELREAIGNDTEALDLWDAAGWPIEWPAFRGVGRRMEAALTAILVKSGLDRPFIEIDGSAAIVQ